MAQDEDEVMDEDEDMDDDELDDVDDDEEYNTADTSGHGRCGRHGSRVKYILSPADAEVFVNFLQSNTILVNNRDPK